MGTCSISLICYTIFDCISQYITSDFMMIIVRRNQVFAYEYKSIKCKLVRINIFDIGWVTVFCSISLFNIINEHHFYIVVVDKMEGEKLIDNCIFNSIGGAASSVAKNIIHKHEQIG